MRGTVPSYEGTLSDYGAIVANTWQHVVVTRQAATKTIRFYVNGVAKGTGNFSLTPAVSGKAVSIGRSDGGTQYVNGRLDEIALYPAALSAAQAAAHYSMRTSTGAATHVALQLMATDPDGDALTYGATGLPPSLVLNTTTGLISGTLATTSAATYVVVVTASDGSLSNSQTFNWTVTHTNRGPVLTNPGNQVGADHYGYREAVLADAPVAYWRFGETAGVTAADSAGASPATMFGGIGLGQPGAVGRRQYGIPAQRVHRLSSGRQSGGVAGRRPYDRDVDQRVAGDASDVDFEGLPSRVRAHAGDQRAA